MTSYPIEKTKFLLLENIHFGVRKNLEDEGFPVEALKGALGPDELKERLRDVNVLGIRSKTHVTAEAMRSAPELLAIGAFCIGTNQIDLDAAELRGIPVFNAPFSNTRSVAEMIMGEVIALARQLGDRSRELHGGLWNKTATGCYEVRGRTIGIIGYGHIGSQVGVLAEMFGMKVVYYDIIPKLPLGNNRPCHTLEEMLRVADFVTLHVPATAHTKDMIGVDQIGMMKKGSYLLNASRNTVVDLGAVAEALRNKHLAGAAVDVFPDEPVDNGDGFTCDLQSLQNVILTPHIGGSTEEAQVNIGREVSLSLTKFLHQGSTTGAVNFPQVDVPLIRNTFRIVNVHRNVPGVLKDINKIVSDLNANIHNQVLSTSSNIGYLIMDLDQDVSDQVLEGIRNLRTSIVTRRIAA